MTDSAGRSHRYGFDQTRLGALSHVIVVEVPAGRSNRKCFAAAVKDQGRHRLSTVTGQCNRGGREWCGSVPKAPLICQGYGECASLRWLIGQTNNLLFGGSQLHRRSKGDRWNDAACPLFESGCKLERHRNDAAIVRAEGKLIALPYRSRNGGDVDLG